MRPTITTTKQKSPELERLRARCVHLAFGLFTDPDTAHDEIEAMFAEIPPDLRNPKHRSTLEAWLLAEVVRRARRCEREAAERKRRSLERAAPPQHQLWRQMHRRGELLPLLEQLPDTYAEPFRMHYLEKISLSEMVRRTGASAGVVTHRIAEAAARLTQLTACMAMGSNVAGPDC